MSLTGVARSAVRAAVRPYEHLTTTPPESALRYRIDPWAHCDDGHIVIPDLVTLDDVPYRPWPHQREFAAAWIDLDRLALVADVAALEGLAAAEREAELAARPELLDRAGLYFRHVHEEKSRQMGMSWTLAYLVWWILAHHNVAGLYQHVDISEVDDGGRNNTIKSFFGRIRFINDHAPERWRAPLRFRGGNAPVVQNVLHPRAFILGEGATADPGRGQRLNYGIQDEAARLPFDRAATAALSRAVPAGRVQNSTPQGEDNEYFRTRDTRPAGWAFLRHHWSIHPVYGRGAHIAGSDPDGCQLCRGNQLRLPWSASAPLCHRYPGKITSPWYDAAVLELTDDQVAMELDIDYAGSLSSRVYPEFHEDTHVLDSAEVAARGLDPAAPFDPALEVELSWDYGIGMQAVGIFQDHPREYRKIGEVELDSAVPEDAVEAVVERLADLGYPIRLLEPEWTIQLLAVGDPAGESRERLSGRPLTADYRRLGFNIRSRRQRIARTINAVKMLLQGSPKPYVIFGPTCPETIRHFKGNTWPVDRHGNRLPGAKEPKNDEHNHMMRADSYLITWKFPPSTVADDDSDDHDAVARAALAAARRLDPSEIEQPADHAPDDADLDRGDGIGYDQAL